MNTPEYKDYCARVDAALATMPAFSTGACPGCAECGVPSDEQLIVDSQALRGATYGDPGYKLRTWDDGWGTLWLYSESLGPVGIVRASTWEEAYSCVIDEIMDDADPEDPDTYARSYDPSAAADTLAEGCHWRSSGEPSNEGLHSPIAQEDLNGSLLEPLTLARATELSIVLDVSPTVEELLEAASEAHFSGLPCSLCDSSLGGDREVAHYVADDGSIVHVDRVCADCVYYAAYGRLDDATMAEVEELQK